MSREAVLLQWEQKIEAAERRDGEGGRFTRALEDRAAAPEDRAAAPEARAAEPVAQPVPLHPSEDASPTGRFQRSEAVPPAAERRTIRITGQPTPAATRRRRPVVDAQLAQPDRIALWAFLLGLLLVAVAAGTAHA